MLICVNNYHESPYTITFAFGDNTCETAIQTHVRVNTNCLRY